MKVSTDSKSKNFSRRESGILLALTNFFGTLEKGDIAEWDLTDPTKPRLRLKCTNEPGNYSFARAFPMLVLGTAFGKLWDSYGFLSGKLTKDDSRKRGTDGQEAPWFDLNDVTALTGYPCAAAEMPETTVITKTRFEGVINGNQLIDTYCHYRGEGDVNFDIWPPYSKLLNIQFQCNFGRIKDAKAHAYGWSGAKPFMMKQIGGVTWGIGHKLELHRNNKFDFLSLCAWDGEKYIPATVVQIDKVWQWVLENWDNEIVPAARSKDIQFQPALTRENLLKSYCDGVHVGAEVLGECDGEVVWEDFEIKVDTDMKISVTIEPETKEQDSCATCKPEKPEPKAEKKVEQVQASDGIQIKEGKKTKLKATSDFDPDGSYWFDENSVAEVTGTWKMLEVRAKPGSKGKSTFLHYDAQDGSIKSVEIQVVSKA